VRVCVEIPNNFWYRAPVTVRGTLTRQGEAGICVEIEHNDKRDPKRCPRPAIRARVFEIATTLNSSQDAFIVAVVFSEKD
jgi:hypothetical protein